MNLLDVRHFTREASPPSNSRTGREGLHKQVSAASSHELLRLVERSDPAGLNNLIIGMQSGIGNGEVGRVLGLSSTSLGRAALSQNDTARQKTIQRHFPTGAGPETVSGKVPQATPKPTGDPKAGEMYPPSPDDAATRLPIAAAQLVTDAFGANKKTLPFTAKVMSIGEVRANYVRICNQRGCTKTDPNGNPRPFRSEDAGTVWGFAAPEEGAYYVCLEGSVLAHVHELLHLNSAPGAGDTFGGDINEGITDYLALGVVNKSKYGHGGSGYVAQAGVVHSIVAMIGEATVRSAYFGNPSLLVSAFDGMKGDGAFRQLKTALTANDKGTVDRLVGPVSIEKKIAEIESLIGGILNWVTDDEIERTISIVGSAEGESERQSLQAVVRRLITSLMDESQRGRLRMGCGLL